MFSLIHSLSFVSYCSLLSLLVSILPLLLITRYINYADNYQI
nr:MAG TPA: hypothetical protein [Crassvirales sp.]